MFIVESGTDVRIVEGFRQRFDLRILGRRLSKGVIISQEPTVPIDITTGPESRLGFARFVRKQLLANRDWTDIIVVQGYGLAALAANLAAKKLGKRCIMLVCSPVETYYLQRKSGSDPDKPFLRREYGALRLIARANANLGQEYCVLSYHLSEIVRAHGSRLPVHTIPIYGVDTAMFRPSEIARAELRSKTGIPADARIVFYSSRIAPEKDAQTLLTAIRLLRDSGRLVVVLHRSGGYRDFVELARSSGVIDQVIATDAVQPGEELARDYQVSDLCVQASRAEGLGFSVLEAMACETPVIASATGGLKETVIDDVTGWVYPVGDAEALAERIAYALDHPNEASALAKRGRQMVIDRFESSEVFDKFARMLSAVGG